jgi:hypothetical protein
MILGAFFTSRPMIRFHLAVIAVSLLAWVMSNNKCFIAEWQRNAINYTSEDLKRIHKSKLAQNLEFFGIIFIFGAIDLYKLKM